MFVFAGHPLPSLRSSTLAMIAGFLVRAVEDNIECEGCLSNLREPTSSSTTTELIAGIDRGGLSYPSLPFVGLVSHLDGAATSVAPILMKESRPLKNFVSLVLPSLAKNPLFSCKTNGTTTHKMALLELIVKKFMRPFLSNFSRAVTELHVKSKRLSVKPQSRKVLKV